MLKKVKKYGKEFLVFCLIVVVIVYAIVGLWCFSSILLGAIFGLSTSTASAVMFIVFVMTELFSVWREEAKAKATKEAGKRICELEAENRELKSHCEWLEQNLHLKNVNIADLRNELRRDGERC